MLKREKNIKIYKEHNLPILSLLSLFPKNIGAVSPEDRMKLQRNVRKV